MSDATRPDAIESLLHATVGASRLSHVQRQRQLERLGLLHDTPPPMRLQPALVGATLDEIRHGAPPSQERSGRSRRGLWELAVVAAVAVLLIAGAAIVRDRTSRFGADDQRGASVEQVLAAAGQLAQGDGLRMIAHIESDFRQDASPLLDWSIESWHRTLADGTQQEHFIMRDPAGAIVGTFTTSGDRWSWDQYGWIEAGSLSAGIIGVSVDESRAMHQPDEAVRLLQGSTDAGQIEITHDERGEVYRLRVSDNQSLFRTVSMQFGVTITSGAIEMVRDSETGNVIETLAYLTSEEGEEITLWRWTIELVEDIPAEQIDDSLFEIPPPSDELYYDFPRDDALPLGLTIRSHRGDPIGLERIELAFEESAIIVAVSPSKSGYDPNRLIADFPNSSNFLITETSAGPVVWATDDAGKPRLAFWDDGRYRFELSVPGEAPAGWDEVALIAVVEALSRTESDSGEQQPEDAGAAAGIPVEQLMGISSPLEPGQGLHAEFQMHTDYRDDDSLTLDWSVERWQRVLPDGTEQERLVLRDDEGRELNTYIRNGDDWSRSDGAWVETGTLGVGFHTVSPYIGWSTSEPGAAARYLDLLADGFPAEDTPAAVETFTDECGDVTRIEGLGDAASEDDNRRFGVTITAFYYELIRDPETGNLLQTRAYLSSKEGVEITIGQWDFLLVEVLPAEDLDATLFEVAAESEFPRYAPPDPLPGNLTLESHIDDFLEGSERLVYTGNGMELIVSVSPSRGGYDPSGLVAVSQPGTIRGADSAVGPITWGGQENSSSPRFAYWDDGRNRFELSVVGERAGWLGRGRADHRR